MRSATITLLLLLSACASDPGKSSGQDITAGDPDACSADAPIDALCAECAVGYAVVDGQVTCDCCEDEPGDPPEPSCSAEPPLNALCDECAGGYAIVDGEVTCGCC
jgi:hypothetical protein